ncbi:PREDICTED: probable V-type proton ATPase 116 kDa subunit a [Atta cephalotes]|uniref:V-type proton ATPase subunit a n=1 Tax=Atta cephalotes TaxID=12957 RepID=A0A158P3F2_ATTCE|nr:PREDICTED: probable V-type proton ATPase 116 kDa subunit a [Atta cephalotes]
MGAMFRSEEMALCQLFIQPEAAYLSVSELGETGTVQFRDLNSDLNYFQRKFVNEVRRCDELERKLRYIEAEVKKDGVPIPDNLTELPRAPNPRAIIDLEAHLEKTENDIQELSQNAVNLKSNYLELTELQHVLEKTQAFFTEEEANDSITKALINEEAPNPAISIRGRLEKFCIRQCGSSIPSFLNVIHTDENPPTFNRTNKFTRGFQNLIDSYGVASYREANPALYTIITFPFLFAVMFGDAGHGFILTLFGLAMVLMEKKISAQKSDNEIGNLFFGGRYIILLMGLFSIYSGLIYNDIFAKSVNIFGSSWRIKYSLNDTIYNKALDLSPNANESYLQYPYPLGLDPVWSLAENKIVFHNSFKMKVSIIFGVAHMIFGVCMNVVNMVYFKKYANLILEFLPQLLFLLLLFFYMTVLMFIKWILYEASAEDPGRRPGCAPSVLITFINMMLFKDATVPKDCSQYMFEGQDILQLVLLLSALLCIPVMLFGKPLFILFSKRKSQGRKIYSNGSASQDIELQAQELPGAGTSKDTAAEDHSHEDDSFGELMIHQAIHTIEYVLSTVSHTASYLRLWALSLAHSQLSEVLWNRVLRIGLAAEEDQYVNSIILFFVFAIWAFFTVVILVLMEGLSAFLHTLRLHWVEFMSKFYEGLGYPFQPFYFKSILDAEDAEE